MERRLSDTKFVELCQLDRVLKLPEKNNKIGEKGGFGKCKKKLTLISECYSCDNSNM